MKKGFEKCLNVTCFGNELYFVIWSITMNHHKSQCSKELYREEQLLMIVSYSTVIIAISGTIFYSLYFGSILPLTEDTPSSTFQVDDFSANLYGCNSTDIHWNCSRIHIDMNIFILIFLVSMFIMKVISFCSSRKDFFERIVQNVTFLIEHW